MENFIFCAVVHLFWLGQLLNIALTKWYLSDGNGIRIQDSNIRTAVKYLLLKEIFIILWITNIMSKYYFQN